MLVFIYYKSGTSQDLVVKNKRYTFRLLAILTDDLTSFHERM